jgi:hypothetical protein
VQASNTEGPETGLVDFTQGETYGRFMMSFDEVPEFIDDSPPDVYDTIAVVSEYHIFATTRQIAQGVRETEVVQG